MALLQGQYRFDLDPDVFDEDESDIIFLSSKPACFAVFGPPGSGKSTVARIIAQFWKCLLLTPETVVAEALRDSDRSVELKNYLQSPTGVPEDVVLDLLQRKLNSRESHHYGYVLDDFPTPETGSLTMEDQFNFLRKMELKIDFVIVLRFPLEDAVRRKEKLYFHSPAGLLVPSKFVEEAKEYVSQQERNPRENDSDEKPAVPEPQPAAEGEDQDEPSERATEADEKTEGLEENADENKGKPTDRKKKAAKKSEAESEDEEETESESETKAKKGLASAEEPNGLVLPSRLRDSKKTTFDHYRRSIKAEKPKSAEEIMDEELKKGVEDVENDLVFFRQLFFPDIPVSRGKMHFATESLFMRLEDSVEWTQDDYLDYKRSFMPELENFMALYYPLRVIEIDGNMPLHQIPRLLLSRFECMRIQKPPIPHPLNDMLALQSILEEVPEDVDEQLKRALSVAAFSPRWKWRRSRFGVLCPVSMFEGEVITGNLSFATVFLDRLYLLADKAKQENFIRSPKLYVMPPYPKMPMRMAILGLPGSGRTTLAYAFNKASGEKVIDVGDLYGAVVTEQKDKATANAREVATLTAIDVVRRACNRELETLRTQLKTSVDSLKAVKPHAQISDTIKRLVNPDPSPVEPDTEALRERTSFDEVVSYILPDSPRFSLTPSFVEPEYTEVEKEKIVQLEQQMTDSLAAFVEWEEKLQNVNEYHPDVLAEIDKVMSVFVPDISVFDSQRYADSVRDAITKSMEETASDVQQFTGWILDNLHRDQKAFALLLDLSGIHRLTDVLVIQDTSEKLDTFRQRFVASETSRRSSFVLSDEEWAVQLAALRKAEASIKDVVTVAKGAELVVHELDVADGDVGKMVQTVQSAHQGRFQYPVTEYVEEEEPDEPEEEEEEDEETDDENRPTMFSGKNTEDNSEKAKPLGDTAEFCPVALQETGTLWPSNPEHGAWTYNDKIYYFSSPEAKEKFQKEPSLYVNFQRPPVLPPLRIFVMGAVGSGRTTHARKVADLINAFVINVRNFMIEAVTPKLQKSPVETYKLDPPKPFWRLPKQPLPGSSDVPKLDKKLPEGLIPVKLSSVSDDPEHPVELTETEQAFFDSLTSDAALSAEALNSMLDVWIKQPPFAGRSLVFDGFPMYAEEATILLERGIFPDAIISTSSSPEAITDRLMSKRKEHWLQERKKKDEKRFNAYSLKKKDWEKSRAEKKTLLVAEAEDRKKLRTEERERKRSERESKGGGDENEEPAAEEDEDEEENEEDEMERIEQALDDEFPEPQLEDEKGEEESEAEEDAFERLNDELQDKIEQSASNIDSIKEALEEKNIPIFEVDTSRPMRLAEKMWRKNVAELLHKRDHLLERAYPVSGAMAKEMLGVSYKRLGKFGTWCPVRIKQGHLFPPLARKSTDWFPVVYRQYIYLLSTQEAKTQFLAKPENFVRQLPPRLCIPVRVAVIGPPKSGKTTLSQRLASEIGIPRISIGEAIRHVQSSLQSSELHRILSVYLQSGTELPDTLEILCLEAFLRTTDCQARGWVLDGFPTTTNTLNLMMQRFIVPTIVFELTCNNKTCVLRSVIDNMSSRKARIPLFNSSHVIATRLAHYKTHIPEIHHYLQHYTRNLVELDGTASKWKLWYTALETIAERTVMVQDYVERREKKLAAPLTGLCVTPFQMRSRLSEAYGPFCPVTLNEEGVLFDCIAQATYNFVVEYREKYYLFATKEKMDRFLNEPELYLPPLANRTVPHREDRAKAMTLEDLESDWSQRLGFAGMDAVSYSDQNQMSSGLQYGVYEWMAEYRKKVYLFSNSDNMNRFISQPEKFADIPEPSKRPPKPEHPTEFSLPMPPVPFLETKVGPLLVQAVLELAELRPKYPLLGYKESALIFLGNYLKAKNPNAEAASKDASVSRLRKYGELSSMAADLMVNVNGIPEYGASGTQHEIFEKAEGLSTVKKELEREWHTLCPF